MGEVFTTDGRPIYSSPTAREWAICQARSRTEALIVKDEWGWLRVDRLGRCWAMGPSSWARLEREGWA
jgi:hypothetical protein